jgi:FMN phosphatase YigB (HAD superfamily)
MLQDALDDFKAEPEDTLFIGDRPEDEQAAGTDFLWSDAFLKVSERWATKPSDQLTRKRALLETGR